MMYEFWLAREIYRAERAPQDFLRRWVFWRR